MHTGHVDRSPNYNSTKRPTISANIQYATATFHVHTLIDSCFNIRTYNMSCTDVIHFD